MLVLFVIISIYIKRNLPEPTVSESWVTVDHTCTDAELQETVLYKYMDVIMEEIVCFSSTQKVFLTWVCETI